MLCLLSETAAMEEAAKHADCCVDRETLAGQAREIQEYHRLAGESAEASEVGLAAINLLEDRIIVLEKIVAARQP